METILEQQRRYHEEYMEVSGNLRDLYDDKDGLRKEELSAISGPNEFAEFYNRLKQIKEFHRKHPNEICVPMSVEFEELLKARENPSEEAQNLVEFTDEEGYGWYLELHDCYLKKNVEYKRYLEMLLEYLQDYTDWVKPLLDQNELFGKIQNEFEKKWDNGTFPGWPKETSSALTHAGAHLELSAFSSWEELASLGLDRLKSALLALGLKCGGTLEERAQRLFSTKGKSLEALDSSLFAKNPKTKGSNRVRSYFVKEFCTQQIGVVQFIIQHLYITIWNKIYWRHISHWSATRPKAKASIWTHKIKGVPIHHHS
uniref:Splicing factor 3A subunit 3 n=1 Tax=Chrysemys picta bellii TaxID=8478 RepID=A0A8C3FJB7_CHRPI